MMFFLVPTAWYGWIVIKEKFPISEARAAGIKFGEMVAEFSAPVLLFLLFLHAMVGYVELGTDSWITNITQPKLAEIGIDSVLLLVYTAGLMFVLRFFAGPIVERINPLGLLFVSAVLACIGLYSMGVVLAGRAGWWLLAAATVYGVGKTFFWPTMLGVVGERFPKGGALAMGAMGGIGMLSAGLLGGPGIGYTQDVYASAELQRRAPEVYQEVKSKEVNSFLFFGPVSGFDGSIVAKLAKEKSPDSRQVEEASDFGGQQALKVTACIPAAMAVGYLLLLIYFRAIGGYKLVEIGPGGQERETGHRPTAKEAIYSDSQADQA
jgi:MFS family permease